MGHRISHATSFTRVEKDGLYEFTRSKGERHPDGARSWAFSCRAAHVHTTCSRSLGVSVPSIPLKCSAKRIPLYKSRKIGCRKHWERLIRNTIVEPRYSPHSQVWTRPRCENGRSRRPRDECRRADGRWCGCWSGGTEWAWWSWAVVKQVCEQLCARDTSSYCVHMWRPHS